MGWNHLLVYMVVTALISYPYIAFSNPTQTQVTAVAPGQPPVMLVSNGSVYELLVRGLRAYYAMVSQGNIILTGSLSNHPALAILRVYGRRALGKVVLLPKLDGALFSTYVSIDSLVSAGYIVANGSYEGLLVKLSGSRVSANAYPLSYPTYFRDAVKLGGKVVAAAAVAVGGVYYAGMAVINGSQCVLIFLNPRVMGIRGFSVKALVKVVEGGVVRYGVVALRGGVPYVLAPSLSGTALKVFKLIKVSKVSDVIPYHLRGFDELIFKGYPTLMVRFPSLKAQELPLSAEYFLVSANGSVIPLDDSFRMLPKSRRTWSLRIVPARLYGFANVLTSVKARHAEVMVKAVNASLVRVTSMPTGTQVKSTHGRVRGVATVRSSPNGFSRALSVKKLNFIELGVGLVLILIACLLRRFLS